MNKNKLYILSSFLGLVVTTLVVSNIASAHWGNPSVEGQLTPNTERFQAMQTERDAMVSAIENRDYQAWKEIVDSRPHITDYINESNFDKFAQMHELMMAGKLEEAQAVRDELGLPDAMFGGQGIGKGSHMGHMSGRWHNQAGE
ncbi:hypothetical protein KKH39_01920 [Patescibacteria group bacterium]|nr:hypothetical protein [Patescibacteria group bacterium]